MLPSGTYWLLKDLTPRLLTLEQFETSTFLNTYVNTTVSKNSSGLINYVPYVLSCLTCLLPYVLLCPTFSRASRARCTSCATSSRASYLTCSRALCAFCLTCLVSYVPRAKRALVSYVSYVLLYLTCLECSWAARGLNPTCSFAPRLSLASGASSLTCSYASHVQQLSCLVPLVLLLLQLSEFFTVWPKVNHCDKQQQRYS